MFKLARDRLASCMPQLHCNREERGLSMALSEVLDVLLRLRIEDRNFVTAYYGTLAFQAGLFSCSLLCLVML